MTHNGEGTHKQHAGLAPFEVKDESHRLRTPGADSGNILRHLEKPESE